MGKTGPVGKWMATTVLFTTLAAACSGDNPVAAPPDPDPPPSSTSAAWSPTTARPATDESAAGRPGGPPEGWESVGQGTVDQGDEGALPLDAGTGDRQRLRYGTGRGDDVGRWALTFRGSSAVVELAGTTQPVGGGIWIEVSEVRRDEATPPGLSFGALVSPTGSVSLWAPPDADFDGREDEYLQLLRAGLIVFPEDEIGPGATWSAPGASPYAFARPATYELLEVDGPLVTVGLEGDVDGVDLSRPGGSRGSSAPRSGTHDGTLTIDTRTGRVMGEIRVDGVVETEDGSVPFEDSLLIESPGEPAHGLRVATTFRHGSQWASGTASDFEVTLLGETARGPETGTTLPGFVGRAGVAGFADSGSHPVPPITYPSDDPDAWDRSLYRAFAGQLVDDVLPAWVDDDTLYEPFPFGGSDSLILPGVGIGVHPVGVTWQVDEVDGADVLVSLDAAFDDETTMRGAYFRAVGTARGEFRVNRFNLYDLEGRIDVEFDTVLGERGDPTTRVMQWWEASPAPEQPDLQEWTEGLGGLDRTAEVDNEGEEEPARAVDLGYGGGTWSGSLEIEQSWTQLDRTPAPTTLRYTLDVDSRMTEVGQWIELSFTSWEVEGEPTYYPLDIGDPPPFVAVVAPKGHIEIRSPVTAGEATTRSDRIFLSRILEHLLPQLPEEQVTAGARWRVLEPSTPEGGGRGHELDATFDGTLIPLEVTAPAGYYIGDRYDGFSISAEETGSVVIDRAGAIPLTADLVSEGTITFGTAGVPDPSTTEPWQSTLRVRSFPDAG